jgi:hypothetical protein
MKALEGSGSFGRPFQEGKFYDPDGWPFVLMVFSAPLFVSHYKIGVTFDLVDEL